LHVSLLRVPPIACADGWLAASNAALGQAGAASIVLEKRHPLIDEITEFSPVHLRPVWTSDPLKLGALALESQGRIGVWIANFLDEPQTVAFEDHELQLLPNELRRISGEAR
jgi:hypothetical protein